MLFANNCNTTLSSSLTNVATTMSVTSATVFPSPTGSQYFYCTLADAATQTTIEIVKVTAVSGTTFTIVRGQDGTSGIAFASGAVVSLRLVRASLNDFPKLDETNTFNADQAISGQLTSSAGLATTGTFTATAPGDGLVMDYATGFGRFSAFAGDGFQWYNAGIANTKLMQLSSSGVITTATWNGATVGVAYGGTGTTTAFTTGSVIFAGASGIYSQDNANLFWNSANTRLGIGTSIPVIDLQTKTSGGIQAVTTSELAIRYNMYNSVVDKYIQASNKAASLVLNGSGNFLFYNTDTASTSADSSVVGLSERMRITSTGGVSIGNTTDPGAGNLLVNNNLLVGTTTSAGSPSTNNTIVNGGQFSSGNGTTASIGVGASVDFVSIISSGAYIVKISGQSNTGAYNIAVVYVNGAGGVTVSSLISGFALLITSSGANKLTVTGVSVTQIYGWSVMRFG